MKVRDDILKITIYTSSFCADCKRAEIFFEKYSIPFTSINIDKDDAATSRVKEINNGHRSTPTIVIEFQEEPDKILVEPTFNELEETFLV